MEEQEIVRCNGCGFVGNADEYLPSMSYHHDLICPECRTSDLDTSGINKVWKERGEKYGYGDDNFLVVSEVG